MKDELTNLLTRQAFLSILDKEIANSEKLRTAMALLVIDINHFRLINKKYNHEVGDKVLIEIARILMEVKREGDFVARMDGSNFAMLLSPISNRGHAELAAFKIQRLLTVPMNIDNFNIVCEASIGLSLYPEHSSSRYGLLSAAESALELAKEKEQPIEIFQPIDPMLIEDEWDMEIELDGAIERSEFIILFQPKVSMRTGLPVGAEALLRWKSPSRGIISPNQFLPTAEKLGFVKPMTSWMINSALRYCTSWPEKYGKLHVSVNIPTSLIEQDDFLDVVESAEKLWERNNVSLRLEILESSLLKNTDKTLNMLRGLRERGIQISIDDFGTGYSCLSYFRDIPADEIKIDQSFIDGLANDAANEKIVRIIIELAHSFGLSVTAEGVEDRYAIQQLKKMDCDVIQGYAISKPMMAKKFQEWLLKYR